MEKQSGAGGFKISAFLALILFIGVIGLWLYSARGLVGGLGRFMGLNIPVASGQVIISTPTMINPQSIILDPTQSPIIVNVVYPTPQDPIIIPSLIPLPTYTPMPTEIKPVGYWPIIDIAKKPFGAYPPPGEGYTLHEVQFKLSYYWPQLGGINGSGDYVHTADGSYSPDGVGLWAACPQELPFGTVIQFENYFFECRDRGGAISYDGSVYWVDILYPWLVGHYWSEEVPGRIFLKN